MKEDFTAALNEYTSKRFFNLEKRLVAGAIVAKYGESSIDGKIKYEGINSADSNAGSFSLINYDSFIKGENVHMNLDSGGFNRESAEVDKTTHVELKDLITKDFYVRADKKKGRIGKTKILETIIKNVFINDGTDFAFKEHVMPAEVMKLMEELFNVTFNRYDSDSSKTYINKGTFNYAFYKVKNHFKKEKEKWKSKNMDYTSMKNFATILIRQEGVKKEDKIELSFDDMKLDSLINLFPKYKTLEDENRLEELNPLLGVRKDYKHKESMEFSEFVYPQLFKELYYNTKNMIYSKSLQEKDVKSLRELCREYSDVLEFDSLGRTESMGGVVTFTSIGDIITYLIGKKHDGSIEQYVSGMIYPALTQATDPHNPLTLNKINEMLEKGLESQEGKDSLESGFNPYNLEKYRDYFMKALISFGTVNY